MSNTPPINLHNTALLLVDIQNIYFEEGPYLLYEPEIASANASKILEKFRDLDLPIIHIKHMFSSLENYSMEEKYLLDFHKYVSPIDNEILLKKNFPNAFLHTELYNILKLKQIQHIVVVGMMSHMCIDTTVRAAKNYDLQVTVVGDACTTMSLNYNNSSYDSVCVHNVYMAGLASGFANVISSKEFLSLTS